MGPAGAGRTDRQRGRMRTLLDRVKQSIHDRGAIDDRDIERLRDAVHGGIGRDEVESLLDLHAAVPAIRSDAAWQPIVVEALAAYLRGAAESPAPPGDAREDHLVARFGAAAELDEADLGLLVDLCCRAECDAPRLLEYLLAALRHAVVRDGAVLEARVAQIRRIVEALRGPAGGPVDRRVADFLFELNDATSGGENHPSWTELFVESIRDHVLDDAGSPGEVDGSEAAWLVERIEADRRYDPAEKALLAQIKHFIRHNEVWGGIRSDDLQAETSGVIASLYSRACDGGKGGDMYYFSVSASDLLTRIAVADVSGHGRAVTDVSQWIYASLAERMNGADGNQVLADLNRLASERGYRALTTAAVVTFYRADSSLAFAYAGHPPMLVRRRSDESWGTLPLEDRSGPANLPLGVDPEIPYDQRQIRLAGGDRLFLYTDGVIEARNGDRELFGVSRLLSVLDARADAPARTLKDAVLDALVDYTGNNLGHDDVTFLVVEVR